jgi:uncharacterized protein
MNFLLIGLITGMVMALTGAGGALVALPLFMTLGGFSLKEASVLSLFAVILASVINYFPKAKLTNFKAAVILSFGGTIGSLASAPFKKSMPDLWIAILLSGIALFSLVMTWVKQNQQQDTKESFNTSGMLLSGSVLGALTTMTGLGGGVVIMPLLRGWFKFKEERAVATSIMAIGLIAFVSLMTQIYKGSSLPNWELMVYLVSGILLATTISTFGTKKINAILLGQIRRIVFSMVVVFAIFNFFGG